MNKQQTSKNNMFDRLRLFISGTSGAVIATMPFFAVWYALFGDLCNEINILRDKQLANRKGPAQTKAERREKLITDGLSFCAKMRSYARSIGDTNLYDRVNILRSFMEHLDNQSLIGVCENILAELTLLQPVMADYGIVLGTVTDYETLLTSYITAAPAPQQSIAEKKEATRDLKLKFKAAMTQLADLDGAALGIMLSNKSFYDGYNDARMIIDLPTRVIVIRGKVVDENGVAIPLVTMRCEALGINRRVSAKGKFNVHNAVDGNYGFDFICNGFVTVRQEIGVQLGIRNDVVVVMRRHV